MEAESWLAPSAEWAHMWMEAAVAGFRLEKTCPEVPLPTASWNSRPAGTEEQSSSATQPPSPSPRTPHPHKTLPGARLGQPSLQGSKEGAAEVGAGMGKAEGAKGAEEHKGAPENHRPRSPARVQTGLGSWRTRGSSPGPGRSRGGLEPGMPVHPATPTSHTRSQ